MHLPALSTEGGVALATPDACATPAEPASIEGPADAASRPASIVLPYPNVAEAAGCERTSRRVLIRNRETVVLTSERPSTTGDHEGLFDHGASGRLTAPYAPNPGDGVVSGTVGGKALFRGASSKVYAERKRIVMLTSGSAHNGVSSNAPVGLVVIPSQTKILVSR